MKNLLILILSLIQISAISQTLSKRTTSDHDKNFTNTENEIVASENGISIITKVIYNAVPDGYHVTYTTSFIGKSVEDVENKMNKKIDSLIKKVEVLKISSKDIVVDVIALDPIFDFNQNDSMPPIGYKTTENVTFNVKSIDAIRTLSKACIDFGIYDLVNASAYLMNSKKIYDSLSTKAVQVLERKKKLCSEIGWSFTTGKITLSNYKEVFYPSERYVNSYIKNATLYKHHVSQNSTINMERTIETGDYYHLNLKDADFVFNAENACPVIQFYYQLNYGYIKKDTEAEMREKIKKEEENKKEKLFYIIDKTGNLKKVEM